jgi:hypothetical protein
VASKRGAVATALLLGAGLVMGLGVGPGVARAGSAADEQMLRPGPAPASDATGRPGASVVQPVGDTVRAGGHAFFDLRVAGNSPVYRVAVGSFDFRADGPWTTATTEPFLAAAGFQKMVADSPAKAAHLERLTPARRMVAHRRDGRLYYLYADPEVCKCLYVGTAEQYQLALEKRRESDELVAMQEHLDYDTGTWDLGAPWP